MLHIHVRTLSILSEEEKGDSCYTPAFQRYMTTYIARSQLDPSFSIPRGTQPCHCVLAGGVLSEIPASVGVMSN